MRAGLCVVCDYPRVKERLNAFLYQLHETLTDLASAGEMSLADGVWCKTYEDLKYLLTKRPSAVTDPFTGTPDFEISGLFEFSSRQTVSIESGIDILCDDLAGYLKSGCRTVLCVRGKAHASELYDMLAAHGISAVVSGGMPCAELSKNHVYLMPKDDMSEEYVGFELIKNRLCLPLRKAPPRKKHRHAPSRQTKKPKNPPKRRFFPIWSLPRAIMWCMSCTASDSIWASKR